MEDKNDSKENSRNKIELSESMKLREQTKNEKEKLKETIQENTEKEPVEKLVQKMGETVILVNRLDFYANSITLGAFCNAVAFILNGFVEAKVLESEHYLLIILFLFGGVGQVITGCLEYIKGRTFSTTLYLTYGLYFISYYVLNKNEIVDEKCLSTFYGSWAFLTFPHIIGSIKVNVFYIIQTVAICLFFILRCVGESKKKDNKKEKVSGILELIGGFASMYIFMSQIISEHFQRQLLPCVALQKDNEIDVDYQKDKQEENN